MASTDAMPEILEALDEIALFISSREPSKPLNSAARIVVEMTDWFSPPIPLGEEDEIASTRVPDAIPQLTGQVPFSVTAERIAEIPAAIDGHERLAENLAGKLTVDAPEIWDRYLSALAEMKPQIESGEIHRFTAILWSIVTAIRDQ